MNVEVIFCDLAKAFDCKSWNFVKCITFLWYWYSSNSCRMINQILSSRQKKKVEIKSSNNTQNFFSNWRTIKRGIPEWSILGPLPFICINDNAKL
jgi:hypothetical protein